MQVCLLRILCLALLINEKRKMAYLQLFIIPVTCHIFHCFRMIIKCDHWSVEVCAISIARTS